MAMHAIESFIARLDLIDWQNEMAVAESRPRVELSQHWRGELASATSAMETRLRLVKRRGGQREDLARITTKEHLLSTRYSSDIVISHLDVSCVRNSKDRHHDGSQLLRPGVLTQPSRRVSRLQRQTSDKMSVRTKGKR
jgi:hypothetical protein